MYVGLQCYLCACRHNSAQGSSSKLAARRSARQSHYMPTIWRSFMQ